MAHFTIKQIEIFIAVAKHLSITKAAESLHLTQPAISRQISKIETQCKKHLIKQIGKKIYLTDTGNLFLLHAKQIIKEVELLKINLLKKDNKIEGNIRLGMSTSLQQTIFGAIKLFIQKYPQTHFDITIGNPSSQLLLLKNNDIDFCFTANTKIRMGLKATTIMKSPMLLAASVSNNLSKIKNLSLNDLHKETFIVGNNESESYIQTMLLFKKLQKKPHKLMVIDNHEAIKNAVLANLGIAFLPAFMFQTEMKEKNIITLNMKNVSFLSSTVSWVQNNDKHHSFAVKKFKEFIFNFIQEL